MLKYESDKPFIDSLNKFSLIAHRGSPGEFPENTIYGFRRAVEICPECILEMDVRLTRDREVVISHDESLERVTGCSKRISEMTLSEIKTLEAGYNITFDKGETYPFRNKGYRMTALEEVLSEITGNKIIIEIKDSTGEITKIVASLVKKYNAGKRVLIGSFLDKTLRRFRRLSPQVATCFGRLEVLRFLIGQKIHLGGISGKKGDIMIVPELSSGKRPEPVDDGKGQGLRVVSKKFIEAVHKKGLPLFVWTIDMKENMKRLIEWGVDGIITNYPGRLREVMMEEGMLK